MAAPFNLGMVARHIRVIFKSDRIVEGATYGHEPVFNFQLARCVTRLNDNEFCERHDSVVRSALACVQYDKLTAIELLHFSDKKRDGNPARVGGLPINELMEAFEV